MNLFRISLAIIREILFFCTSHVLPLIRCAFQKKKYPSIQNIYEMIVVLNRERDVKNKI